jgi:glutamate formiminotransferase/formiminotetrahydrofolate cyclodeaminase
MTTPLVECVPNFSDARRPEVIEAISRAIASVDGVYVLDHHSDMDHNRTVITFVGSPEGVEAAAFRGIAKAAELIDLNEHTGEHPRIGATDVVPFVPISGTSMQECVEIAKRLGKRVADELNIPVYLYEEAASNPSRRNLETHRKGQYETLKQAIATDPNRVPDFGPKELGPAGATVIGAREFLIAYNVYLTTNNVEIAKKIAKTIRHSSGGLRYLKALGLLVEGHAQVSMNLTNFRKTSIPTVVEAIRREAQRYGASISHSELVGLIPQDAVIDTAVWYTQMDMFKPEQVLERKLYAVLGDSAGQQAIESTNPIVQVSPFTVHTSTFLDDLAAGTPTPGGGSAAAYAGAMGAALVGMVARLTIGKSKYENIETQMQSILDEAEVLREILTAAIDADSAAFNAVMDAYRLPKDDDAQKSTRAAAIQKATLEATQVPFETARKSLRVMQLAIQVASLGNTNAITDAGTGATLAQAALKSASYNVRINTLGLEDKKLTQNLLNQLVELEKRAAQFMDQLNHILKDCGGLPLG